MLVIPGGLDFSAYDFTQAGEPHRLSDYEVGEVIDHVDGVTIEEAEHMMATRLWQNTSKTHFDATPREDRKRLIYGGHVMSMARALSFNGLANAQCIVAINAGSHANPCFAGDTVRAWSEVLDTAQRPRARCRRHPPAAGGHQGRGRGRALKGEDGKYLPDVLLDLDYWALMPV
jgi:2-methylfumaryl-CoA hydratase